MLFLLLAACSGSKDDTGLTPTVDLQDANNFDYTGTLTIPAYPTHARADVEVCWDQLTKDILCHDLDPASEILDATLVRLNVDKATAEDHLAKDQVPTSDFSGYVDFRPSGGDTCANLSDFSLSGSPFIIEDEYAEDANFLLILSDSLELGVGARMMTLLTPMTDSDVDQVEIADDACDVLEYTADLTTAQPITLGDAPWIAGWADLTQDGMGNPLEMEDIDSLMIAFYEGQTPESLQTQLLDLELIATDIYTLDLNGAMAADLTQASGPSGNFSGLSGDGTWLLALRCNTCYNPAPKFLGVLQ